MQSADGRALPAALPGQYVVLRLRPSADGRPLYRSYSLSGAGSTERYRISVKVEPNGAAGEFLRDHVAIGRRARRQRAARELRPAVGHGPVVLLSAGIGATPVLAMLHALAADAGATRQVLWLHAARDREHHPFAAEVRRLMAMLPRGRAYVCYSRPGAARQDGRGLRRRRTPVPVDLRRGRGPARRRRLPLRADPLHGRDERGAGRLRRGAASGFTWSSSTAASRSPRGSSVRRAPRAARRTCPRRTPTPVRWCRSPAAASRRTGTRLPTRASWSWPRRATFRSAGRAGPASVTPARAGWSRGRSTTIRRRSTVRPKATCSSAAHDPPGTSSSISEPLPHPFHAPSFEQSCQRRFLDDLTVSDDEPLDRQRLLILPAIDLRAISLL